MFRVVFENLFFRFLLVSIGLYLGWYCLYEFYLHTQTSFDKIVIDGLVRWSESTLQVTGYATTDYSTADVIFREHIGIAGSKGVTIGAPCDGVVLYALFVFFVAAFPGSWKHKLWFIPLGAFSIFYLNVLRIVGLAIIMNINEEWLAFNHDYTFTVLVYAYVFALWMVWVQFFSPFAKRKMTTKA